MSLVWPLTLFAPRKPGTADARSAMLTLDERERLRDTAETRGAAAARRLERAMRRRQKKKKIEPVNDNQSFSAAVTEANGANGAEHPVEVAPQLNGSGPDEGTQH